MGWEKADAHSVDTPILALIEECSVFHRGYNREVIIFLISALILTRSLKKLTKFFKLLDTGFPFYKL